ncbi:MAG: ABC transporter permease, partial [Deltaproteobacteria bacterium]|nr:ABC transporter permease [Deltaproteobacteria bacterium]
MEWVRKMGAASLESVAHVGVFGLFFCKALFYCFASPLKVKRVIKQIRFIGWQSLPVIVLTGGFAGMVLGFQGFYSLSRFGSDAFLGP